MNDRIVVSGIGIFTALGLGVEENFKALSLCQTSFSELSFLNTKYANQYPFAEIKMSTSQLIDKAALPLQKSFTRTSAIGILALNEAFEQAGLSTLEKNKRIGLVNATTVGSMCEVEKYYYDFIAQKNSDNSFNDTIDCADCTHKIADYFHIKDYLTTISTACSSSANAIMLGARLLQNNMLDIAICGGTDALTRFTINGFSALKNIDKELCKPFSAHRNGLNLGEGAAYLILEKETSCLLRGRTPLAILSGYANYNESFHPTAPNPEGEGAFHAMELALKKAQLTPSQIHYINAHGTATLTNDESESNAMKKLFSEVPPFSSTKCYTGHTLAASGAVEAVYSILSLKHGCLYANLNFKTPIEPMRLVPQTVFAYKENIQNVMSNSFAFGGNNASLIFSKYAIYD